MNNQFENSLKDYFSRKDVEKVILFGSHARAENTKKSDIDVIIIKKTNERFFDRYREFIDNAKMLDRLYIPTR